MSFILPRYFHCPCCLQIQRHSASSEVFIWEPLAGWCVLDMTRQKRLTIVKHLLIRRRRWL